MKLIVLNLPRDFTEDALTALFSVCGTVVGWKLVTDNKTGASKGFGFIEMATKEEALAAISKLHGTRVSTATSREKIRVKLADSALPSA